MDIIFSDDTIPASLTATIDDDDECAVGVTSEHTLRAEILITGTVEGEDVNTAVILIASDDVEDLAATIQDNVLAPLARTIYNSHHISLPGVP